MHRLHAEAGGLKVLRSRPQQQQRPGRRLLSLAAFAALAAGSTAQAQSGLRIVPSIQLTEIVTNNVNVSATDKHADAITRATASLSVGSTSGILRGFLDYGLTAQVYVRDSSRNGLSSQNSLNADADVEVIENRAFVNVRATVSQGGLSVFGAQPSAGGDGLANPNATEIRTLRVAPRLLGYLGRAVRYSVNGAYGLTSTKGSSVGDATTTSLALQLANANPARVGWVVDVSSETSDFKAGRSTRSDRVYGTLTLGLEELDLRLGANAGREYSDLVTRDRSGVATWGLSADWIPSARTQVNARYDERAFGKTYSLNLQYRTPLTVWTVSDSRSVSVLGNGLQVGSRGAVFDLFYAQFASIEPDPQRRIDLVNQFLIGSGLDPNAGARPVLLTSGASIQDVLSLSAAYRLPRGSATLIAARTSSRRADALSAAVDDLSRAGDVHQRSITLNLSHRLTPELSASLGLSALRSEGVLSAVQQNSQRMATVQVGGPLSPKSSWSVALRRTLYETSQVPYNESAVTASYSLQL